MYAKSHAFTQSARFLGLTLYHVYMAIQTWNQFSPILFKMLEPYVEDRWELMKTLKIKL